MLTIAGPRGRYCDGISRRSFLRIGGLALGGMTLPEVLRAEAASGNRGSEKAVIMVLLPGGPPHLDMWDLKPNAPAEIRGEFQPIATRVPGIEICELMPRLAGMMDKLVPIRSLVGGLDDHNLHQCLTGWESHPLQSDSRNIPGYPEGGWPSIGSVISKLQSGNTPTIPPFISLATPNAESMTRAYMNQSGYLGAAHAGFEPLKMERTEAILPGAGLDRLADRRGLLNSLDTFRRRMERDLPSQSFDTFTTQAYNLLTSSRVAEALDISKEDVGARKAYGIPNAPSPENGGPKLLETFLAARRLVEAGVRCVTLAFSRWPLMRESQGGHNWDWHNDNFKKARLTLPMLDIGVSALIEDLAARDRLDDVSVVVWGEFGRSPRINGNAGRDHWPQVGGGLLAGGGIRAGQVLGATNKLGDHPIERPVHFREVFATLYHNLGINGAEMILQDRTGRPHALLDQRSPILELI